MSRANDITLLIIIMQASIGFVDATGMFTNSYHDIPQNNATFTITDLESYAHTPDQSIVDSALLLADWSFDAFLIGIKVIFAVVFVLPTLVTVFNIPAVLATFIQVGVYYIYATWYAQFKSKAGWKGIE